MRTEGDRITSYRIGAASGPMAGSDNGATRFSRSAAS